MNRSNCSKCSKEFEKSENDKTTICQTCGDDLKTEILNLQIFKWVCYSCAIFVFLIFVNLAFAEETTRGNYIIPGKGKAVVSNEKFNELKIVLPLAIAGFGLAGFYLGIKEKKKKEF